MRFLKWTVLFAAAFMMAWILIFTFTQDPFKSAVPARILTYNTPAIPVYIYVAGAFGAGLLIGLWVALYYYIIQKKQVYRKSKELGTAGEELVQCKSELERLQAELERKREILEQYAANQQTQQSPDNSK